MTKTELTLQQLNDMGVQVFCCGALNTHRAISSADGFIGLAPMETSAEAHTVLEHERMHFVLDAFSRADASFTDRLRLEGMVRRATYFSLAPRTLLESLLRQGLTPSEVAEELNITPDFLQEAFDFYRDADPTFCASLP